MRARRWIFVFVALSIVAGVYIFYGYLRPTVIFGLRSDYAHAIPFQRIPDGLDSIRAESCGECHGAIYQEWKSSMHAQAYGDPFFQAYWKKDGHIWVCLNCHAPLENQQPTVIGEVPGARVEKVAQQPNPHYDPEYQKEAVTCAACHVRDGVILGPFEDSVAPHPTRFDPSFRTTEICYRCHNVVSGPFQFYNVGPCGTYAEYEGRYFMKERGMICQSCHMPEVERPVADAGPIRHGRRHLWRGGHDPDMIKRAVAVDIRVEPSAPKPGDPVRFVLTLINAGAGHKIPTGDPDRHFTVEFVVQDERGRILEQNRATMGRWILWQPVILELYDNRLMPLASREYAFGYRVPNRDKVTLTARVRYHILTDGQHTMLKKRYGLSANDPYSFLIYERRLGLDQNLAVALRDQSSADRSSCQLTEG
jgi:hypothetical protein